MNGLFLYTSSTFIGLIVLFPNSLDVHFDSGSTCVVTPLESMTSIPEDSDQLIADESSTVYFEKSGNFTASSEVPCIIALEVPREITSFHFHPASPITRAHNLPLCREITTLPSFDFCREIRVFASSRTRDLSENMSTIRESAVVKSVELSIETTFSFSKRIFHEAVTMMASPITPVTSTSFEEVAITIFFSGSGSGEGVIFSTTISFGTSSVR